MPDWFYRTVSRPLLFRLPAQTARDFTLRFLGTLARLPLGPGVIDFLGHMAPPAELRRCHSGVSFPTIIGLGCRLDSDTIALPALARFGFGFLEVGPITLEPTIASRPIKQRPQEEAIWFPDPAGNAGLKRLTPRIAEATRLGLPVVAHLAHRPGASLQEMHRECECLIRELSAHVQFFSLPVPQAALAHPSSTHDWQLHFQSLVTASNTASAARQLLLRVAADADIDEAAPFIEAALSSGFSGLHLDGSVQAEADSRLIGARVLDIALQQVRELRRRWPSVFIIGAGGVHEPAHALAMHAAGADLVQIDSGLVYTGPGLPKRINDALLHADTATHPEKQAQEAERAAEMTWLWTTLLGAGMLFGSLLTLVIAITHTILPYDESFVGMSREQLMALNPRLLPFMAHDRITLAGTMVAIGLLYTCLSLFGVRRGMHWAQQTIFVSAFTGFASFFLFLGFGYLDPLHAFVTACLLQLLLLGLHSKLGKYQAETAPQLKSDWKWRYSLWGQLLLILHSVALLAAGVAISFVGVTQVFVPEDLEFMQTTTEALRAANPRLVPLVAHDRATLGGMLLSSGWAFLLPALWGYRNGRRWLWWALLVAGLCAYAAAIGVHLAVSYTAIDHLIPAFAGLGLFLLALGLSYPYLCSSGGD